MKRVFVSSTGRDLSKYREAVIAAIDRMDGFECVCMERFGSRDAEADPFCRGLVAECHVFVGTLGHIYGSCPQKAFPAMSRIWRAPAFCAVCATPAPP